MDYLRYHPRKKKEKIDALKLQINFRRKVLGQVHADKTIFQFSHNRKPLSIEELSLNLSLLFASGISSNGLSLEQLKRDPELLIYRRIEHLFDCGGGKETWFKGTVLSYEKEEKHYSVVYITCTLFHCWKIWKTVNSE